MTTEINCISCGATLSNKKRSNAKYCSQKCGDRYRNRKYYRKNLQKMYQKRYWDNQKVENRIHYRVKHRAKRQGIPFDITPEDIKIVDKCPVLGIDIVKHHNKKGYHPNSLSLDRIYPEKGYVKGNVRVISARANLLKNDATIQELELVLKDLKDIWGEDE